MKKLQISKMIYKRDQLQSQIFFKMDVEEVLHSHKYLSTSFRHTQKYLSIRYLKNTYYLIIFSFYIFLNMCTQTKCLNTFDQRNIFFLLT